MSATTGGTGIGFVDRTKEWADERLGGKSLDPIDNAVKSLGLPGTSLSSNLFSDPFGTKEKQEKKAEERRRQEEARRQRYRDAIMNSDDLGDEQKKSWLTSLEAAIVRQSRGDGADWEAEYKTRLKDLAREGEARRVYTQELFNAATSGVNAKLQQTQISSFLGATGGGNGGVV